MTKNEIKAYIWLAIMGVDLLACGFFTGSLIAYVKDQKILEANAKTVKLCENMVHVQEDLISDKGKQIVELKSRILDLEDELEEKDI